MDSVVAMERNTGATISAGRAKKHMEGCWERLVVTGRLSIATTDGLLHYSAVSSEPLESKSLAPAPSGADKL